MLGVPKVCSVEPRAQEMSHWGKKERKKGFWFPDPTLGTGGQTYIEQAALHFRALQSLC